MGIVAKTLHIEGLSAVELLALRALWKTGPVSARELYESLGDELRRSYLAT